MKISVGRISCIWHAPEDNVSSNRGTHGSVGFELNRTSTTQTFVGFANGRYIFDSISGFMNYVNIGPKFVECSNGVTNNNGCFVRLGTTINRSAAVVPAIRGLWRKDTGAGRHAYHHTGGTGVFLAQIMADQTESDVELRLALGRPRLSRIRSLIQARCFLRRLSAIRFSHPTQHSVFVEAISAAAGHRFGPTNKGKTLIRLGAASTNARTPGLDWPVTRSTNGSVGQSLFFASFFNGFGVTPPAYTHWSEREQFVPDHPQVFVTDKKFTNPRPIPGPLPSSRP